MFFKINFLLLVAVTLSALYVVDLRLRIQWQTATYSKARQEQNRINQDYAGLIYDHSRLSNAILIENAATSINMHKPSDKETIILKPN